MQDLRVNVCHTGALWTFQAPNSSLSWCLVTSPVVTHASTSTIFRAFGFIVLVLVALLLLWLPCQQLPVATIAVLGLTVEIVWELVSPVPPA